MQTCVAGSANMNIITNNLYNIIYIYNYKYITCKTYLHVDINNYIMFYNTIKCQLRAYNSDFAVIALVQNYTAGFITTNRHFWWNWFR